MLHNTCKCLVFAFVLLAGGVNSASKDDSINPESLVAQARKLQTIWTDGTPPITMRMEIQVFDAKGKITPGRYNVDWLSRSRWREEVQFASYKRLRVHDAKGYWQQGTLNFQPQIIFQLDTLLDSKTVLSVGAKQVLGKLKTHDKGGVRQKCTEVKWTTGTERTLCFDGATGSLLSVEYLRGENQHPPDISRIEYSAFNDVGERRIPFEIRAFRDRAVVATVKVLEITAITDEDPALFLVPQNSEFWPQCDDMQYPELTARVQPRYPLSARSNREQGRAVFYAVIEADGTLSHLTLVQRATPTLEAAAAEAIRQWHYKPAVCGSTAIRMETSIPVDFWLERYFSHDEVD
jgi:TonB family protein